MNLNRIMVVLVILVAGIFVASTESIAGKPGGCTPWPECKDGGGDPPPPPPPTGCVDTYPGFQHGFIYKIEQTRKTPRELHFSSYDGCRTQLIAILPDLERSSFHMTSDGLKGVIVWTEEPGIDIDIVRRLDFTVDESGELVLGQPVTILPLIGEEAPPDHSLDYNYLDIWGDATHSSLYMTISRQRGFGPDPIEVGDTRVAMIYDLNDLTDVTALPDTRVIHNEGAGEWLGAIGLDCSSVFFPQFVPNCYGVRAMNFNPSGTRLYFRHEIDDPNGLEWDTVLRVHIDREGGATLADWTISEPELVYTGDSFEYWPQGMTAWPASNPLLLPSPEIIGFTYYERHSNGPEFFHVFLDADRCASDVLAPLSGGNLSGLPDIFMDCIDTQLGATTAHGAWQSADATIFHRSPKNQDNLYRRYVDGEFAGTEELLVEDGVQPDTGL
jgi:hypothetical protein